jgi:hypothetical protein
VVIGSVTTANREVGAPGDQTGAILLSFVSPVTK